MCTESCLPSFESICFPAMTQVEPQWLNWGKSLEIKEGKVLGGPDQPQSIRGNFQWFPAGITLWFRGFLWSQLPKFTGHVFLSPLPSPGLKWWHLPCSALRFVFSSSQKRAASAVTQAGRGRNVLWISGNHSKALESLPKALRRGNETLLPHCIIVVPKSTMRAWDEAQNFH